MKTNAGAHQQSSRAIGPHYFVLPATFAPAEYLPVSLSMYADDARWLVSTILRKLANKDIDHWGCVRLHSNILRRVMNCDTYAKVIAALVAGGAIEQVGYSAGIKAKGFRLAKRFLDTRCVRVRAIDPRLIQRIDRQRQQELRQSWQPIHFALAGLQQSLTLAPQAGKLLDSLPDHSRLCQSVLVERIQHREYSFSVSSTGRVFNSITGLKREIRSTLRFDGAAVGNVDIACCQPALLAMLLKQQLLHPANGDKSPARYKLTDSLSLAACFVLPSPCPDFPLFASLASSGAFYGELARLSGYERNDVKRRFLIDVLAKHGRYRSEVENTFGAHFPTVLSAIRTINRENHAALIRLLQRAESWLVIHQVAPRLIKAGCPVVTLHDAIFTPAKYLPDVEAAFHETLAEIGFPLSLKRELPA